MSKLPGPSFVGPKILPETPVLAGDSPDGKTKTRSAGSIVLLSMLGGGCFALCAFAVSNFLEAGPTKTGQAVSSLASQVYDSLGVDQWPTVTISVNRPTEPASDPILTEKQPRLASESPQKTQAVAAIKAAAPNAPLLGAAPTADTVAQSRFAADLKAPIPNTRLLAALARASDGESEAAPQPAAHASVVAAQSGPVETAPSKPSVVSVQPSVVTGSVAKVANATQPAKGSATKTEAVAVAQDDAEVARLEAAIEEPSALASYVEIEQPEAASAPAVQKVIAPSAALPAKVDPTTKTAAIPKPIVAKKPVAPARVLAWVNMRNAPSAKADVLTVVPADVKIDAETGCNWCVVTYKGKRGYIYKDYLRRD